MVSAPSHRYFIPTPRTWTNLRPWFLILISLFAFSVAPFFARAFFSERSEKFQRRSNHEAARLSTEVTVHAAGRGNPKINLSDGRELLTSYVGPQELSNALQQNLAEPLSLAAADFDEDGVPDMLSGYAYNGRGMITLHRGNVDWIYANAPEAKQRIIKGAFTDAPFLSPGRVFDLPVAADFLATGDFDADGHFDLAAAGRGCRVLLLLAGDGRGGFALPREISLTGGVTALVAGEINRADGLTDIAVGVAGEKGSRVLVFEGPEGALRAEPEVLKNVGPVSSLALGQFDNSYETDLAIAAGPELLLIHGRDRKLSLDAERRATVKPALRESRQFDAPLVALATGEFGGGPGRDLALLDAAGAISVLSDTNGGAGEKPAARLAARRVRKLRNRAAGATQLITAKVSAVRGDDLLALGGGARGLELLSRTAEANAASTSLEASGEPVAVLPLRLNGDALDDLALLHAGRTKLSVVNTSAAQTFTVNTTADTDDGACNPAQCTLREALNAANQNAGSDTINFQIDSGVQTITLASPLPAVADPVTIDGTTQPGFAGTPVVVISAENLPLGEDADSAVLTFTASNSVVRGLVINHAPDFTPFPANFMHFLGSSGNIVEGNYLGTDATGAIVESEDENEVNAGDIKIAGGVGNLIGGTTASARNLLLGFVTIRNSQANLVRGNYLGVNPTGTAPLTTVRGGTGGVRIEVSFGASGPTGNNVVGGTTAGAANVVHYGIFVSATESSGNLIQGNFVGVNASGTATLSGAVFTGGVQIAGASNTVGGTSVAARNIISGQIVGIGVGGALNLIQGNYVGIDVTGSTAIPNDDLGERPYVGILISDAERNTIGGTVAGARNVVSGGRGAGIAIRGFPSMDNSSGGARGNAIQGNYVGTNAAGTAKLPNQGDGIEITNGSTVNSDVTIGGDTPEARNIISGNGRHGINIGEVVFVNTGPISGARGVLIQGNYIGTDVFGSNCLGNTGDGVFVDADSTTNTIKDNFIACNGQSGINIPQNQNPGVRIFLDDNRIYANAVLGIDLGAAGVTPNDPLDADGGANLQQNFPLLTSAVGSASGETVWERAGEVGREMPDPELAAALTINGILNSTPNQTFTVHWYFSGPAQCASNQANNRPLLTGKVLGVTTNGNGDAQFSFPFDFPNGVNGGIINCTATDAQGNTSEFSACMPVNSLVPPTPTAPMIFVEAGTNNLAALDSVSFVRGPFALTNTHNYSSDQRTRIIFFTTDLGFEQPTHPDLNTLSVQVGGNSYTVESVVPNPTISGSAIVFRLPDLAAPGTYPLGIRLGNVNSANAPNLQIVSSQSSPAAAPKSNKTQRAQYRVLSILDLIL
jgi:CSLREA domain-containing protein